jgi:bifunctional non-homologous end joining protein LigD
VSGRDAERHGVRLTNLDQPLFDGAAATKRDLVDYLDGVRDRILPVLHDRPLSVVRVHRGHEAFMQKNAPRSAPPWVRTVTIWAETSRRDVAYVLCNDRRTLLWLANQRAIEYHPALVKVRSLDHMTHLVLDLDPPDGGGGFALAVRAAHMVREVLGAAGLAGAVKTSGAKGLHVFVPIDEHTPADAGAAATRALAGRVERLDPSTATTAFLREDRGNRVYIDSTRVGSATVVAAYSPRVRSGTPVSFPVSWDELDNVSPAELSLGTALGILGDRDPWGESMPAPQNLPAALVEEGRAIPAARVQAMHEGRRRARARRAPE